MSWTDKESAKIRKWVDAHKEQGATYHIEHDEGGEHHQGPYGHWVYVDNDWIFSGTECGTAHEHTIVAMLDMLSTLRRRTEDDPE
ncbi:hypothetical protein KAR91_64150 [Candidatus Pacearchaeota archaeon]|nr:hypothetical protein [Candidatus Pacearchaeota archaeon]